MQADNIRLLVVERLSTHPEPVSEICRRLGHVITTVPDGRQVVEYLSSNDIPAQSASYDLLLFGPDISEDEIVHVLDELERRPDIEKLPSLLLATEKQADKISVCLTKGLSDYSFYSLSSRLVDLRIKDCLEKHRLRVQAQERSGLLALEHDMQIGRKIQRDFLPALHQLPQPKGWEIAAGFHPARQVAGDFFDAFPVGRDKVGLVIADVCDKGVGPAIFMSLSRSLLRAFAEQHRPLNWLDSLTGDYPSTEIKQRMKRQRMLLSGGTSALLAVGLTNKYICENHGDMNMFATLFFGVLDPSNGLLTYINGGHDSPIILDGRGNVKTRLEPTGPAIGILPDADFEIEQTTLEPDDVLMMFTDGATDALNPAGEMFGEERLLSLLQQQPIVSVADLLNQLVDSLRDFIAEADQFDDITMLAARRASPAHE